MKKIPEENNGFGCKCHQYSNCITKEYDYKCIDGKDMYNCELMFSVLARICTQYDMGKTVDDEQCQCLYIVNNDKKQLKLQMLNENQNKIIERKYKSDEDKKQGININGNNDEYLINYMDVFYLVMHEKYHYIYMNYDCTDYEDWYVLQTFHEIEICVPNRKYNNCEVINITRNCKCKEKCLTKLYVKNYPCTYNNQSIFCDEYVEDMKILDEDCDKLESSSDNIISDDFSIYSSTNRISVITILTFVYLFISC